MNILLVNLKHLYQKRSMWLIGLIFASVAIGVTMAIVEAVAKNKQGVFCAPGLWMLFVGAVTATLQMDVLTKQFSYCLPGHKNVPRKFLFIIGLPLSFLWSLSFLFYPGLSHFEIVLSCLAAFSAFTIFYWFGAWFVFRFIRSWSIVFALFPLLMLGDEPLNISVFIVHTIVASPLPIILLGGLVNFLVWSYWGNPNLQRRYCGQLWIGPFVALDRRKMAKFQLEKMSKIKSNSISVSPNIERFFISQISHAESGSLKQYVYGILYKLFAVPLSNWYKHLLIFSLLLCFLGYCGRGGNIFFIMMPILFIYSNLFIRSNLLISGGRKERFWSAVFLIFALTLLITILLVIAGYITGLLTPFMPTLPIGYGDFFTKYSPLNLNLLYIPLILSPLAAVIGLIFYKKPLMISIVILIMGSVGNILVFLPKSVQIPWLLILVVLLCSWAFAVLYLRYFCMRKSLVA